MINVLIAIQECSSPALAATMQFVTTSHRFLMQKSILFLYYSIQVNNYKAPLQMDCNGAVNFRIIV